jgi:hypothetical protein
MDSSTVTRRWEENLQSNKVISRNMACKIILGQMYLEAGWTV